MFSSSDIDYLFEDHFPFENLPAEIRNEVFKYSISEKSVLVEGQSRPVALRINQHGELVVPAFTAVSRQTRYETRGYVHSAIQNDGLIHVQIMDYDTRPLHTRLDLLSQEHGIPKTKLLDRVVVTLLGELNIDNILSWIINYLVNPKEYPFFRVADSNNLPKLDGYGEVSLFTGKLSLPFIIDSLFTVNNNEWDRKAYSFIENMEDFLKSKRYHIEYLASKDDETLEFITRIINFWIAGHVLLQRHKAELQRPDNRFFNRRGVTTMREKLFAMGEIMYNFRAELEGLS
ncbi:hypothetical protein K505DRAFT_361648 [Melanomma pulvis-pyrius CBS 109.77]|uniref:Uncharacterized protein n=1 Tax=Melanomma pulvis-pyrius CBS 109.77 TaxID=1314802 RepID=A0A6A6XDP1_9PLEO|nr:hypothetical protein K505DRAFT_361648 [Melanomma pulvis-pyrius CBS 109.77]